MNLSGRLKALRSEFGVTQIELGKMLGINNTTLSDYERNDTLDPSMVILSRLSNYFDVSISYLIGESDVRKCTSELSNLNEENRKMAIQYIRLLEGSQK